MYTSRVDVYIHPAGCVHQHVLTVAVRAQCDPQGQPNTGGIQNGDRDGIPETGLASPWHRERCNGFRRASHGSQQRHLRALPASVLSGGCGGLCDRACLSCGLHEAHSGHVKHVLASVPGTSARPERDPGGTQAGPRRDPGETQAGPGQDPAGTRAHRGAEGRSDGAARGPWGRPRPLAHPVAACLRVEKRPLKHNGARDRPDEPFGSCKCARSPWARVPAGSGPGPARVPGR